MNDHHPLSVRKVFKQPRMPSRLCKNCLRRVVYVVSWTPLCRKHALEEFIRNLRSFIEGAA